MSTIGAATSYTGDISAFLGSSADASSATGPTPPTSDGTAGSGRDPATRVELSDKVKAILARASTDQDIADRLKAFVESHRSDDSDGSTQDTSSSGLTLQLPFPIEVSAASGGLVSSPP